MSLLAKKYSLGTPPGTLVETADVKARLIVVAYSPDGYEEVKAESVEECHQQIGKRSDGDAYFLTSGYAILYKRSVDRRPFRLWRNSFMKKHVGRIVWYNCGTIRWFRQVKPDLVLVCYQPDW